MDPTQAQRDTIARIRRDFGKPWPKVYAPKPPHGIMRVQLQCVVGTWQWYFDQAGSLTDAYLTARLFDPPTPQHVPRNAIDN